MKLITFISLAALTGIGVFAIAVLYGTHVMGAFSFAMMPLFLIGVVRDYSPRQSRWEMRNAVTPFPTAKTHRSDKALKLAA